jgi:hypothetical protein
VVEYAAGCVEREALSLMRAMQLALLSAEVLAGRGVARRQLAREVRRMLGVTVANSPSAAERQAIAAVEREIAADFPFYADERRLDEIHDALGLLRLREWQ